MISFELVEDVLDLSVGAAGGIVVSGPGFLEAGGGGEVGWKGNRVVFEFLSFSHVAGFGFAAPERDLPKPRLLFFRTGLPRIFCEGATVFSFVSLPAVHADLVIGIGSDGVEIAAVVVEVVVIFTTIEGKVSGLTHEFGDGFHALGEVNTNIFWDDAVFA